MLPRVDTPLPKRITDWARQSPLEAAAWLLFALVVAWFYGFFTAFGPAGAMSAVDVMVSSWNEETDYGHGFLIPPTILGLLAWRFWYHSPGQREFAWQGMVVFVVGLVLWVLAYRLLQWRVAIGSLTLVTWGAIWYALGRRAALASALPVFLLLFAVPVPGLMQATNGLQVLATQMGYYGSRLLGIDVLLSGTMIQSPVEDKWGFDIVEGCSGIRSLMAMVLIAAVYVYIIKLPVWRKALVFVAAVPLAILVNAIRITSIIVLAEYFDPQFAAGIYHDYASFFIFPVGLIGMLAMHQILTIDRRVKKRVVRRRMARARASEESSNPSATQAK